MLNAKLQAEADQPCKARCYGPTGERADMRPGTYDRKLNACQVSRKQHRFEDQDARPPQEVHVA